MDKKKEKELFKTLINNKVNYHFENLEIVSQSSWIKRIISECEQIWEWNSRELLSFCALVKKSVNNIRK